MGRRLRFSKVISFPVPGIRGDPPPPPPPRRGNTCFHQVWTPQEPHLCPLWTIQSLSVSSGETQSPSLLSETPRVHLFSLWTTQNPSQSSGTTQSPSPFSGTTQSPPLPSGAHTHPAPTKDPLSLFCISSSSAPTHSGVAGASVPTASGASQQEPPTGAPRAPAPAYTKLPSRTPKKPACAASPGTKACSWSRPHSPSSSSSSSASAPPPRAFS